MHISKSHVILNLIEGIQVEQDETTLTRLYQQTGVNLLDENITDQQLRAMIEADLKTDSVDLLQRYGSTAKEMGKSAMNYMGDIPHAVSTHVSGLYRGLQQMPLAQTAMHHPALAGAAGGAALALGAAAALRARARRRAANRGY